MPKEHEKIHNSKQSESCGGCDESDWKADGERQYYDKQDHFARSAFWQPNHRHKEVVIFKRENAPQTR